MMMKTTKTALVAAKRRELPGGGKLAQVVAAVAFGGFIVGANAQETLVLEEVVVTAQKRAESVQDIPATVNAVSGQALDEFKIFDFADVASMTPGLSLDAFDTRSVGVSLRGVSFDPDANASPTVDVYWNGIIARSTDVFSQMFDIERIEVLRGPQGTLQGKTSPSGAIQLYTKRPSFEELEGTIETSFSDNDGFNTRLGISLPVANSFAIRIAGVYDESELEGITNLTTGTEQTGHTKAGRLTLDWQPTDTFSAVLISEYFESSKDGQEDVAGSDRLGNGRPVIGDFDRTSLSINDPVTNIRNQYTSFTMTWEMLGQEFTSISGYRDTLTDDFRDRDTSGVQTPGGQPQFVDTTFDVFIQELRMASIDTEFWQYIVGLYYEKSDSQTNFALPLTSGGVFLDIPNDREQFGVFLHNKFDLTDSTNLQAGIRWNKFRRFNKSDVLLGAVVLPQIALENQVSSTKEVTGGLKISHYFNDDLMAYVGYDRSFRPPGAVITPSQGINSQFLTYEGESSDAVEIGVKSTVWDGRAQINGSLFYQTFDGHIANVAEPAFDGDGDGIAESNVQGGITFNGDAIVQGAEVDYTLLLSENWTLSGGVSYSDAKFDGAEAPCNVADAGGTFVIPADNSVQGVGAIALCTVDGSRISSEPNLSSTLNTDYTVPLDTTELYVRGLVKYTGPRAFDNIIINGESGDIDSNVVANLYAGFRDAGGAWDVSVWAKNLFDEEALTGQENEDQFGGGTTGYRKVRIIPERTIGITAQYNFSF